MALTFWATLWYAGAVVVTIGYEGQTLEQCEIITETMITNIETAYADEEAMEIIATSMFPTNQFDATCETELLPIDEEYAE